MFISRLFQRSDTADELPEDISDEAIQEMIRQALTDAEETNYRNLKRQARRLRRQERRTRSGFEKRLMQRWGRAFVLFDLFLIAARQFGADYNHAHAKQAEADQNYVFAANVRIHARACLIASEIRALIASGHSSGALARWRLLHELAVVAFFLKEHGNDVAERYILHDTIQAAKQSDQYERHYQTLGMEPQDPENRKRLLEDRERLVARFGRSYLKDYGWAAGVLPGDPTFDRIEAAVNLEHWRPHVGMASNSVHAGFRGMMFDIGHMDSPNTRDVLLAGPSNAGLADPGHSAVISLIHCTIALLAIDPTPESVVGLKILQRLADEVGEAFIEAHEQLEKDDARLGAYVQRI